MAKQGLDATPDVSATPLPSSTQPAVDAGEREIVKALEGYRIEADANRKSGLNPRDDKWRENLNLYWNRIDFSGKAAWQARETMPEVPAYVDRFAAALKDALMAGQEGFYTVKDPSDENGDIAQAVKRMTDVWLSRSSRNQLGQLLPFSVEFENQMKQGAMMAAAAVVTWKDDVPGGRVAIEGVDPRFVWLDHTYRNLYRMRRIELDLPDLMRMAKQTDRKGKPIFNLPEVSSLISSFTVEDKARRMEASGHGQEPMSGRPSVVLDEYIATVVNAQGEVIADRALMVVANNNFLVRGPEANPFWHGQDWLVYTPLVPTPFSVYGRTYMEDFGAVAATYTELTNMILDAVRTVSLKAYALVPGLLLNPEQVAEGLTPNKLFLLEEGTRPEDFAKALDLGSLPPESYQVWQAMKNELTEAANINEIGLGQFAPKGRTSATEINQTQQSSSALIRSLGQTIETRLLNPILDLTWKTGLQHVRMNDPLLAAAAGDEMTKALLKQRKELITRPFTFQARGISETIRRSTILKSLLGLMQVIGQNQILMQEFIKVISVEKLVKKLFELSDLDITMFQLSDREKLIASIAQPLQGAQQQAQGQPSPPGQVPGQMQQLAQGMGIAAGGPQ